MSEMIHWLHQIAEISPEERDLKRFTRRLLMKLSNWSLGEAAPTANVPPAIRQLQELLYSDALLAAISY
jgi:hypothetical protein